MNNAPNPSKTISVPYIKNDDILRDSARKTNQYSIPPTNTAMTETKMIEVLSQDTITFKQGKNGNNLLTGWNSSSNFMQPIFCNNCGDRGHAFRDCKKPVLSCGIILLRNKSETSSPVKLPLCAENIELLMVRRKDSMSYTEFMRGKYDVTDISYITRLLENMTESELHELNTQPFESLWSKMWNYVDRHEHEMPIARDKFNEVSHILKDVKSVYTEPEWGFPKGRRFRCESDIQCAEREFGEETNIPRNAYIFVKDVEFNETFIGTNGIPYQHRYFLALVVRPDLINTCQKLTQVQKREISAVEWKTTEQCIQNTRPHYVGRSDMLSELTMFVNSVEVRIPNFVGDDNGNTCFKLGT